MGIKDKMMASMMDETTKSLGKVLESLHAYMEIIARETIRMRLEMKKSGVSDDEVESIVRKYQERLN